MAKKTAKGAAEAPAAQPAPAPGIRRFGTLGHRPTKAERLAAGKRSTEPLSAEERVKVDPTASANAAAVSPSVGKRGKVREKPVYVDGFEPGKEPKKKG